MDENLELKNNTNAQTRLVIALIVGIFSAWKWLFIIPAIWALMEFYSTYGKITADGRDKYLPRGFITKLAGGYLLGYITMIIIASAVKGIKLLILHFF